MKLSTTLLMDAAGLQADGSAALAGFQPVSAAADQPEKENCGAQGEGECLMFAPQESSQASRI